MLKSGLWSGFYEQFGTRHAQEMVLDFADGLVRGDGKDGLGRFIVYFTDGRGRLPEQPGVAVLWAITHDDPFVTDYGAVVRVP